MCEKYDFWRFFGPENKKILVLALLLPSFYHKNRENFSTLLISILIIGYLTKNIVLIISELKANLLRLT
jgi:hypothetical protein